MYENISIRYAWKKKPAFFLIIFTVMISLMSCGKREKEIILRQPDPQAQTLKPDPQSYEDLEKVIKEMEETAKIKAGEGKDGEAGDNGGGDESVG